MQKKKKKNREPDRGGVLKPGENKWKINVIFSIRTEIPTLPVVFFLGVWPHFLFSHAWAGIIFAVVKGGVVCVCVFNRVGVPLGDVFLLLRWTQAQSYSWSSSIQTSWIPSDFGHRLPNFCVVPPLRVFT